MPQVVVSARNPVIPPVCACCGGPAQVPFVAKGTKQRGVNVVHVSTREVRFGACQHCINHFGRYPSGGGWVLLTIVLGLASFAFPPLLVGVVVSIALGMRSLNKSRALLHPYCQAADRPAVIESWSGNEISFYFDSPAYAAAFANAQGDAGYTVLRVNLEGGPLAKPDPAQSMPRMTKTTQERAQELDLPWNQQKHRRPNK